jgi:Ran GTPase-activating protein (RanGAP) involved in mRNA processing and transport
MVVYDDWSADAGFSIDGHVVLCTDIVEWPPLNSTDKPLTLCLGDELTMYNSNEETTRLNNLKSIKAAKERPDISYLQVHYSCVDESVMSGLLELLTCDERKWESFTLKGINHLVDFYSKSVPLEDYEPLLLALSNVKVLNIGSCSVSRGHGLEALLRKIPFMPRLGELRIQSSELDQVSVQTLIKSLQNQNTRKMTLLSLKACTFPGENSFRDLVNGLQRIDHLQTLNLSFCVLEDEDIIYLVNSMERHPSLKNLHIGGNHCTSMQSVQAISSLIQTTATIRDLNLRALWIDFNHGSVQRLVNLVPFFRALRCNSSLQSLTLSENYLTSHDIEDLAIAIYDNRTLKSLNLSHNNFGDRGAYALLEAVRNCSALEELLFENHYCRFHCSEDIKTHAHFNWADKRLLQTSDVPISLWPKALAHVNEKCNERYHMKKGIPDVLFRLLTLPTGECGLPLAVRVAMLRSDSV